MLYGEVGQFLGVVLELTPELDGHLVRARRLVSVVLLYEARLTQRLVAVPAEHGVRATAHVRSWTVLGPWRCQRRPARVTTS